MTPAAGQSKIYGEDNPAALTYTFSPALHGSDALTGALSRAAGENAGTYAITLGTLSAGNNYTLSLASGTVNFAIEQREITLVAENKTVLKGGSLPELTYTVSNLASGESKTDALSDEPTLACPTFNGNTPGSYVITLTGGTATGNYTITVRTNGTLTVAEQIYTVTIMAGAGGSITSGTSGSYGAGMVISLSASPASGYRFDRWTSSNGGSFGNASSAGTTFTVPANATTVTAVFVAIGDDDSSRTLTDDETGITVSGYISEGAVLTIGDMTLGDGDGDDTIRLWMEDDDYVLLLGVDISLSGSFTGTLTISLPVGSQYNGQTVTILHAKNDGTLETITATIMDGKATFTVTSLSPFAVFVADGLDDIPKTGDSGSHWVWWLLCGASAAGITALCILGRRKKSYRR